MVDDGCGDWFTCDVVLTMKVYFTTVTPTTTLDSLPYPILQFTLVGYSVSNQLSKQGILKHHVMSQHVLNDCNKKPFLMMCCKKVEKIVEGGEAVKTPAPTSTSCFTFCTPPDLPPLTPGLSPLTPGLSPISHTNSYHGSSKHSNEVGNHNDSTDHGNNNTSCFTFPATKPTSLIFSFSSPKKCSNNEIIYPSLEGGALDVSPPYRVQPQLDLLFPPARESPHSGGSGDEKHRTLLQSRRGSSASLIIDLSPKSPLQDNVLFVPEKSPTEDILKGKTRKFTYKSLGENKDDSNFLYDEFSNIPPNTVWRKNSQVRSEISLKNRYPDIIPNAWSSVELENSEKLPVYINANFVSGFDTRFDDFIATQGPLPCTMNDFWLMIWKMECSVISMITKLREKHKEKCVQYWPTETSGEERYGDVIVTFDSEIERNGYTKTTLYISYKGCRESRKITHFWFTSWPDHKVPSDTRPILSLIQEVRELQKTCGARERRGRVPATPTTPHTIDTTDVHTCPTTCPVTVHCSAGRGRTGCFIAISIGMNMIDNEDSVDILKIVSRIRIYRGGLVDKVHQYIFLYKTLYDYWTIKHGLIVTSPLTSSLLTSSLTSSDVTTRDLSTLQESNSDMADGESSQVEDPCSKS